MIDYVIRVLTTQRESPDQVTFTNVVKVKNKRCNQTTRIHLLGPLLRVRNSLWPWCTTLFNTKVLLRLVFESWFEPYSLPEYNTCSGSEFPNKHTFDQMNVIDSCFPILATCEKYRPQKKKSFKCSLYSLVQKYVPTC